MALTALNLFTSAWGLKMRKLPPDLEMLTANLPPNKRTDIEASISSSPHLMQQMLKAVREDHLDHIRMDVPDANRGGYYDGDSKSIYISSDLFTNPENKANPRQRLDTITGILGHETEHAFQAKDNQQSVNDLAYQVQMKIRNPDYIGTADMTDIAGEYIKTGRKHEADAEIAGWNAVASRVVNLTKGNVSSDAMLGSIALTTNCVSGVEGNRHIEKGIILDSDYQMSDTRLPKVGPINREPVAACHFDLKPSDANLGKEGKSDYTNYYGALAFEIIKEELGKFSPQPAIAMDMAKLKLKPELLESNGLDLNGGTLSVLDRSPGQSKYVTLHHTGSGNPSSPKSELDEPVLAQNKQMNEPGHSGFKYFDQALMLLHSSEDPRLNGLNPEQREKLAANAAANALREEPGFSGFDHAVCGRPDCIKSSNTVFLVQGEINNPAHHREGVEITKGMNMPIPESSQVMDQALITQQQVQQQNREQLQSQSQQGPTMRMSLPGGPSSGGSGNGGGE
jgi:hypothetical protein